MNKDNKNGRKHKIIKYAKKTLFTLSVSISVLVVGGIGIGAGVVTAFTKDEKIREKEDYNQQLYGWSQTSYAYFKTADTQKNKLIGAMHNEQDRVLVNKISDVTPYLTDALISTEDHNFYNHNGIVLRSILRAVAQQVMGNDVQTGGSTITQQLVKNEILNDRDKSYERKAKEVIHALRIEKYYDKETILVKYMNSIYFGKGANYKHMYGVAAAARGLFNKNVKNLTLAEAAYIAGMGQRPNAYNPFYGDKATEKNNVKLGKERMELVLKEMLENGKITQKDFDTAVKAPLEFAKSSDFENAYSKYPYIISAIESKTIDILQKMDAKYNPELAKEKNKKDYRDQVEEGGLRIYTTLDETMYNKMNEAAQELNYPTKQYNGTTIREQVGAVLIDNKTGGILSFVAGTDFSENQKNHAFDAKNQPGSAIKPLLAYGPAMNEGFLSPNSIIIDEPVAKSDGSGVYRNANGKYSGAVSAIRALQWSYNIPAVKVFRQLGKKKGWEYLDKMGIPAHEKDGEALVLGGATIGYTVEQMTSAFSMIANNGTMNESHLITKITDAEGNVLYDHAKETKSKEIFSPATSYALTNMLKQVVKGGTASNIGAQTAGYNIAGKTGTTTSEYDLWFVGYSPEVSLGVWSGYDYNFVANKNLAKNAWAKFFRAAAEAQPNVIPKGSDFQNPGSSLENKCFECDKVPKEEEKEEKDDKEKGNESKDNSDEAEAEPQPQTEPQPEPDTENQPQPEPENNEDNSNDTPNSPFPPDFFESMSHNRRYGEL